MISPSSLRRFVASSLVLAFCVFAFLRFAAAAPVATTAQSQHDARRVSWCGGATAVDTDWTSLGTLTFDYNVGRPGILHVHVWNATGGGALTHFRISIQGHPWAEAVVIYADTDFDTATQIVSGITATGPHELGAAAAAWFRFDADGVYSITFEAKSASASTVTVIAGGALQ